MIYKLKFTVNCFMFSINFNMFASYLLIYKAQNQILNKIINLSNYNN